MSMQLYKQAGVDVEKGDEFTKRISKLVGRTITENVTSGVGGFASLYDIGNNQFIAASTDGVGTKLKLATQLADFSTLGIDLVAMCANDLICTGARPLFFLDYYACGQLDLNRGEDLIKGMVEGCLQAKMALVGGETAEMPGVYPKDGFDLAGFNIGIANKDQLITGEDIKEGDKIIALASSGIHSNGLSLARALVAPHEKALLADLLTPTRIYVDVILDLLASHFDQISGLAHITGGGIQNIARLNKDFDYHIDKLPGLDELPPVFSVLAERAKQEIKDLYNVFNMGMGMVIITTDEKRVTNFLNQRQEKHWVIGEVRKGQGRVHY